MFNRLVSLGAVLLDVSMHVPALPTKGGDAFADFGFSMIGGGHNVDTAASRLGMAVTHAGSIGVGLSSENYLMQAAKEGISFAGQVFEDSDIGICLTLIEVDGERTFVTQTAAESRLTREHLDALKLGPTDVLYFSGYDLYHPGSGKALGEWLRSNPLNGAALVFDPTSVIDEVDPEVIEWIRREAFVISLNEAEFEKLEPRVSDRAVFVKRIGAAGSQMYESAALRHSSPGIKVDVVDTTGAGDVHVGAMIAALAQGKNWADTLALANRAAAYCVTKWGGPNGPTLAQLNNI